VSRSCATRRHPSPLLLLIVPGSCNACGGGANIAIASARRFVAALLYAPQPRRAAPEPYRSFLALHTACPQRPLAPAAWVCATASLPTLPLPHRACRYDLIVVGVQESKYDTKRKKSMKVKRKVPKAADGSPAAGTEGGDASAGGGGPVMLAVLSGEDAEYEEIEVEESDEEEEGDASGAAPSSGSGTGRDDDSDLEEEVLMEAVMKAAAEVRAADETAAAGADGGAGAVPAGAGGGGGDGAPRKMKRKKRFAGVAAASLVGEHAELHRGDGAAGAGSDPAVGLSPRTGSDAEGGAGGKPPTPTAGGGDTGAGGSGARPLPVAYSTHHHSRATSRGMRGSLTETAPGAGGGGGIIGALVSGQFAAFVKHAATQANHTPVFEAIKAHVGVGTGWVEVCSVMMWQTGVIVLARE